MREMRESQRSDERMLGEREKENEREVLLML